VGRGRGAYPYLEKKAMGAAMARAGAAATGTKTFGEFHYDKIAVKETGKITKRGEHNERTGTTPNADPERRHENVRLVGSGDWLADVQARVAEATYKRSDSAIYDFAFYVSNGFFDGKPAALLDEWARRTLDWLAQSFGGERNVVAAVLHKDETTPHIQVMVVPIDERGHMNAHGFTGTKGQVIALHDSYNAAVAHLGLDRGIRGSVATHQTVREWYGKIQQPTPAREEVLRAVEVERPGRLVGNPERYASEQQERIVERIAPALDAALVKATHYEGQAAQAEANNQMLQQRVRELERDHATLQRDYKAVVAQVRQLDLRDTMRQLGGEQDRHDKAKWRIDGEHISINGEKFYNHDRGRGGGGPIDLVMHVTGYDFKGAVTYLSREAGAELAVAAAAQHGARERAAQAEEIVARNEPIPFQQPEADERRWPQVRAYLVEQRAIPRGIIDELHAEGKVYAATHTDRSGREHVNAVFLTHDAEGHAVGASLRGTLPGSTFKGLSRDSDKEAGYFSHTVGEGQPGQNRVLVVAESPLDGLSAAALLYPDYRTTVAATDGTGPLPTRAIEEALAQGWVVSCAFDNDQAGEKRWREVRELYPTAGTIVRDLPPAKDWNDALRASLGQDVSRQHERGRSPERERDRDTRADQRR